MTEERIAINNYIKECEKNGTFDIHTTSPDLELSLPVDESFEYIKKGMKHWIPNFIMKTAGRKKEEDILKNTFQLKIVGKENLNNISNSIVICNHVHMFDCVIVRHAFKHKNLYITAAEFNNRSDALGFYMRYMGMMPFSSNHQAMKNMHRAMQKILHAKKGHILFYPEASEWLYYEKPRPFKIGAFHYAVTYDVPIQPMFITFVDTGRVDQEGNPLKDATLHVLAPIYANKSLQRKERMEDLAKRSFEVMKMTYEEVYQKPLKYTCEN